MTKFSFKKEAKAVIYQIGNIFGHDSLSSSACSGGKNMKNDFFQKKSSKELSLKKRTRFINSPLKIISKSSPDLDKPFLYENDLSSGILTPNSLSAWSASEAQDQIQEEVIDWKPTTSWWAEGSGSKFIECIEPKLSYRESQQKLDPHRTGISETFHSKFISEKNPSPVIASSKIDLTLDKIYLRQELSQHKIEWEAMLSIQQADTHGTLSGLTSRQIRRLIKETTCSKWLVRTHGPLLEDQNESEEFYYESSSETVSVDCISEIGDFSNNTQQTEEGFLEADKKGSECWSLRDESRIYFKQLSLSASDKDL
ncbi:hypothetical protein BY996DRAFT_6414987 [Phakopsora pachyrhizi]|nr:hypothetical protein BY996DRAFT_6414987 [Phakopsora pachyrhizi]